MKFNEIKLQLTSMAEYWTDLEQIDEVKCKSFLPQQFAIENILDEIIRRTQWIST